MVYTGDRRIVPGAVKRMNLKSAAVLLCLCLLVPGLVSCGFFKKKEKEEPRDKSLPINWLDISVAYDDGSFLPSDCVLTLTLEDVTGAEAPGEFVGETVLEVEGAPPYAASLGYNPELIREDRRYAIRAEIRHYDRLLYTNAAAVNPFEKDAPVPVIVQVVRVPRPKTE